jgi:FtsP/CotA-like multicopper oxidase with cupredoxin domain
MIGKVALLSGLVWSVMVGDLSAQEQRARSVAGGISAEAANPLTTPSVLPNRSSVPGVVEVRLTAAPARIALLPGGPLADVYAYNGSVPGPTLELHEGDRVIIHFRNDLPEPTTVHWHGLNLPADADGSPFYPVPPGGEYDYKFTVGAGTAGTYWYHPHPDGRSGYQIAKGLFGAIIIRAPDDPLRGIPERLLILADNRFGPDGAIDLPHPDSPLGQMDMENGREGDILFVNGRVLPTVSIRPGAVERWRIINASAARVYRLAIAGQRLLHVGSDGGLFERPEAVDELVLANSERVELLVRGDGTPGTHTTLQALPYDRYDPHTRPADWTQPRDLLTLAYSGERPRRPVAIPATLRVIPALDTAAASATRLVVLSQGLINGKTMDMNRIDFSGRLGTTEIWEIENVVGMDHPFHLHGFHFQVLDRNGVPVPFRSWKDSINVPKHETVRIIVRFDGYPGKWMYHCHILDHEDQGMMGVLELH